MAENFTVAELIIPGTYVRVRAEGLIGVGGISTGNIGIVGTAARSSSSHRTTVIAWATTGSSTSSPRTTIQLHACLWSSPVQASRLWASAILWSN